MRAYSMDLRERALLDSDAGMKAADVAAKYRVSGSWVRLLKQRRRETRNEPEADRCASTCQAAGSIDRNSRARASCRAHAASPCRSDLIATASTRWKVVTLAELEGRPRGAT